MGMFLIVFNAYSDRAGIACPKKLDSWCGLDRFGIGQNLTRDGCVGELLYP